jgi:hypothetical protein
LVVECCSWKKFHFIWEFLSRRLDRHFIEKLCFSQTWLSSYEKFFVPWTWLLSLGIF